MRGKQIILAGSPEGSDCGAEACFKTEHAGRGDRADEQRDEQVAMRKHGVVWLTGLSGAGKTTVAGILRSRLLAMGICPVMLDGDRLRRIYPAGFGYSAKERRQLGASYGRLAHEIANQGHLVICSTISLFREIHRWNREHLPNYVEVWLRVPLEELRRRDAKGIYNARDGRGSTAVAGQDFSVEFPESPDLVIDNFGAMTAQRAADQIIALMEKAYQP